MTNSLKVWSKFSVKKKGGTFLNLKIVDMPEYLGDKVINLYIDYFVKQENTFIAAGIPNNPKALEETYVLLQAIKNREIFHTVICCPDNDDEEIQEVLGASMMALVSKGDPETKFDFKTKEMQKLFEIIHGLEARYDEMKVFNLDRCFSDRGIFVCPQYRGLGIAQHLLKARRLICKEHGIPINGAWMTSYGTQKAAERDGWETVFEIENEEIEKMFAVTYGREPPTKKFMIARIEV